MTRWRAVIWIFDMGIIEFWGKYFSYSVLLFWYYFVDIKYWILLRVISHFCCFYQFALNFHGICVRKVHKTSKSIYIRNTSNGTKMSCLRSVSSIGSYWHPFLGICCLHSLARLLLLHVFTHLVFLFWKGCRAQHSKSFAIFQSLWILIKKMLWIFHRILEEIFGISVHIFYYAIFCEYFYTS